MGRFRDNWQPILYALLALLVLAIAYLVAFVIKNSEETEVDFVFVTTTASLVWVILISLALGLVTGVLLSQLYRRGQAHDRREALDSDADRVREDEAIGEAEGAPALGAVPDEEVAPRDERHA